MKAVPRPQKLMAAFLAAFFFQLVTDVHFTPQSDIFGPLAHSTIVEPDVLMGVSSPFHSMEGTIDGTKKGI